MTSPATGPRITFDCIIFGLQQFGGISSYWGQLTSHALATGTLNFDLLLPRHVRSRAFSPERFDGVAQTTEQLPVSVSRYLPARAHAGSVFHTSYYRLPRGCPEQYVVTVYDFIYERYRSGLARWVHKQQKLASIRRADDVICISEYTRKDVLEFCPDVDPARVHVVPLAVDHDTYFPDPAATHQGEGREVLFVGQRGGYKRFDLAVEALRQSPHLSLGIVGPALTPPEQALLADRLGQRWTHHGAVPAAELRRLYAEAFCFVFPSDYEGFGLPLLEAMASGCPVVSSSAASLPEVGGAAARYALQQTAEGYAEAFAALQSAGVRDRMIADGLLHSHAFSWARTCERTFAIYCGIGATDTRQSRTELRAR
jgi:mannosyltransferase